jgi:hypothetical protein
MAVLAVGLVALAGCGSSSSSSSAPASGAGSSTTSTTHFAKTKFVFHAGLAFGAFHRWIYKPAKAGTLRHPFEHPLTAAKAAVAAAFVYHELKLALDDAQASPTLSKLVAPITALQNKIHGLAGSVKSGGASAGDASSLDSAISSIKGQAASAGQPITEQTPASPSG